MASLACMFIVCSLPPTDKVICPMGYNAVLYDYNHRNGITLTDLNSDPADKALKGSQCTFPMNAGNKVEVEFLKSSSVTGVEFSFMPSQGPADVSVVFHFQDDPDLVHDFVVQPSSINVVVDIPAATLQNVVSFDIIVQVDGELSNVAIEGCERPCDPNPCKHGGLCMRMKGDEVACICKDNWVGDTCEEKNELPKSPYM